MGLIPEKAAGSSLAAGEVPADEPVDEPRAEAAVGVVMLSARPQERAQVDDAEEREGEDDCPYLRALSLLRVPEPYLHSWQAPLRKDTSVRPARF